MNLFIILLINYNKMNFKYKYINIIIIIIIKLYYIKYNIFLIKKIFINKILINWHINLENN